MKRLALLFLSLMLFFSLMLHSTSVWAEGSNLWKKGYYTDEFNEATGEEFAYIDLKGTFSNTATTDSDLSVRIIADFNDIQFYLLEYETYKLTSFFDTQTYTIRIKDGSDNIHTFSGWLSESTNRIFLDDEYRAKMLDILKKGGKIRFSITDDHSASTKYVFSINNANNFESQWDLALGYAIGYMSSFSEGVVAVLNNDKMGAMDASGRMIVPCIYDIVYNSSNGMLMVYSGEYMTLDGGARMNKGAGQFGYISNDGTKSIAIQYDAAKSFTCNRAFVKKGGKWGCIDTDGNLVIPYQYDYVNSFSDDRALVFSGTLKNNGYPDNGTYSFIDLNGNTIFTGIENGFSFSDGLARVVLKGKCGYINTAGELVIKAKWDDAGGFNEGLTWVISKGIPHIIDTTGNIVTKCNANNIKYIGSFSDGMAYVWDKTYQYGFINEHGKLVIPCTFKYTDNFQDGYTLVRDKKQKYGIIDKNGNFSVPCKWDEIKRVGNYYCIRKFATINKKTGMGVGGTYGLIDAQGNTILDCIYSSINYGEGFYTISKDSEWMIFDHNLKQVY